MGRFGLALVVVVLLAGGCRKVAEPAAKPLAKPADGAKRDEFGLPLVIRIQVPEAPAEVQKPSPPIPKESETH